MIAQQSGSSFQPYQTAAGDKLSILYVGAKTAAEMFAAEQAANTAVTWMLRILGWLGEPRTHFPDQTDSLELGVCVKQIQEKAGISQSTASQFMTTLQRVGLVSSSRRGRWTYYKRSEPRVAELCAAVEAAL